MQHPIYREEHSSASHRRGAVGASTRHIVGLPHHGVLQGGKKTGESVHKAVEINNDPLTTKAVFKEKALKYIVAQYHKITLGMVKQSEVAFEDPDFRGLKSRPTNDFVSSTLVHVKALNIYLISSN